MLVSNVAKASSIDAVRMYPVASGAVTCKQRPGYRVSIHTCQHMPHLCEQVIPSQPVRQLRKLFTCTAAE